MWFGYDPVLILYVRTLSKISKIEKLENRNFRSLGEILKIYTHYFLERKLDSNMLGLTQAPGS